MAAAPWGDSFSAMVTMATEIEARITAMCYWIDRLKCASAGIHEKGRT